MSERSRMRKKGGSGRRRGGHDEDFAEEKAEDEEESPFLPRGKSKGKSKGHASASLTCEQLREELRRRGLSGKGRKAALVDRLEKSVSSKGTISLEMSPSDESSLGTRGVKRRGTQPSPQSNGDSISPLSPLASSRLQERIRERNERESLVLWRRPLTTLHFFAREFLLDLASYGRGLLRNRLLVAVLVLASVVSAAAYTLPGPHQRVVQHMQKQVLWCLYWVGLGILSSVGLGTGLHTFLLYLGPHIASVTMAAYECGSLDFPEPPYPNEIWCPDEIVTGGASVSLWSIMSKVRVEAFMWGAGTALGELPPYFMARAARLSSGGSVGGPGGEPGDKDDDEDDDSDQELREFEELQRKKEERPEDMTFLDRAKLTIERLVERVGFMGIMLCASIPNPLFDLAGITCGHFLIPFWTFFGATLVGKAVVKMHLQKLCVIVAFSEALLERLLAGLAHLPLIGGRLQTPFRQFLKAQKAKLHRKSESPIATEGSILASIFEKVVIVMIAYFVVSIVNSLAQSYHKRLHREERKRKKAQQD